MTITLPWTNQVRLMHKEKTMTENYDGNLSNSITLEDIPTDTAQGSCPNEEQGRVNCKLCQTHVPAKSNEILYSP